MNSRRVPLSRVWTTRLPTIVACGTVDTYASIMGADESGLISGHECGEAEAVQMRFREDIRMWAVKDAREDREGARGGSSWKEKASILGE